MFEHAGRVRLLLKNLTELPADCTLLAPMRPCRNICFSGVQSNTLTSAGVTTVAMEINDAGTHMFTLQTELIFLSETGRSDDAPLLRSDLSWLSTLIRKTQQEAAQHTMQEEMPRNVSVNGSRGLKDSTVTNQIKCIFF